MVRISSPEFGNELLLNYFRTAQFKQKYEDNLGKNLIRLKSFDRKSAFVRDFFFEVVPTFLLRKHGMDCIYLELCRTE